MATVSRMSPEDLTALGITKPTHRKRISMELHRLNVPDQWPSHSGISLKQWLTALKLQCYLPLFESQNVTEMKEAMKLNWEDLQDIGIEKLGHIKRLCLAIRRLKVGVY